MVAVGEHNRSPLSVRHWIGLRSIVVVDHPQISPDCYLFVGRSSLYIAPLFVRICSPYGWRAFGILKPWVPPNL